MTWHKYISLSYTITIPFAKRSRKIDFRRGGKRKNRNKNSKNKSNRNKNSKNKNSRNKKSAFPEIRKGAVPKNLRLFF